MLGCPIHDSIGAKRAHDLLVLQLLALGGTQVTEKVCSGTGGALIGVRVRGMKANVE
jgi:hypothetical protein